MNHSRGKQMVAAARAALNPPVRHNILESSRGKQMIASTKAANPQNLMSSSRAKQMDAAVLNPQDQHNLKGKNLVKNVDSDCLKTMRQSDSFTCFVDSEGNAVQAGRAEHDLNMQNLDVSRSMYVGG